MIATCVLATALPTVCGATTPPDWTADAIWYQVLIARFANGEPSNDPPQVLAWDEDWDHLLAAEEPPLRTRLFYRRYGGDLQGLRDKLGYLADLGVNTLYLNPVFQAPSQHKYDTADHRHIDDSFGVADSRMALSPESHDPATWQWSASDRLFLDLLAEAHRRGIRVVIDGVFNHVGTRFWAWEHAIANGPDSPYADWFAIRSWGPPVQYEAWDGDNGHLPEFSRSADGLHPEVEAYLFAVVRRWMDPNGDGDPRDGVDGWRLDAAEQVPLAFWRKFRRVVKQANPEAVILGEIWTDASEWLAGDAFDIVTNYPFSNAVVRWTSASNPHPSTTALADELVRLNGRHRREITLGMFNLLGSHDTERAATMMLDYPPPVDGVRASRDRLRPGDDAYRRLRLAAVLQFASPGAPVIYYGDELGMFGGNDPFCRGPMQWSRLDEASDGAQMRDVFRRLCAWRKASCALRRGAFRIVAADDARQLVALMRDACGKEESGELIVVNAAQVPHTVDLTLGPGNYRLQWRRLLDASAAHPDLPAATDAHGRIRMQLPPQAVRAARVVALPSTPDERGSGTAP